MYSMPIFNKKSLQLVLDDDEIFVKNWHKKKTNYPYIKVHRRTSPCPSHAPANWDRFTPYIKDSLCKDFWNAVYLLHNL